MPTPEIFIPHISDMLNIFMPIISDLLKRRQGNSWKQVQNNIIIGGTHALKLHGLILPRPPQDLDLVIYNPTPEQLEYIQSIRIFHIGKYNREHSITTCKSFVFKKQKMLLNVILEHGSTQPQCELLYNYGGQHFEIQSIENVLAAKNSYRLEPVRTSITGMRYVRAKDVADCIAMKNLNFNIVFDGDASTDLAPEGSV